MVTTSGELSLDLLIYCIDPNWCIMFTLPATTPGGQIEDGHGWHRGRSVASEAGMSESQLIQVWQQFINRSGLITEENEPFQLIYPGRANDDRGPDLRDAVILTSRGLVEGDIEFHLWSSDWKQHCHHEDPAYNRTILHAVMWPDIGPVPGCRMAARSRCWL